MADGNFAVVLPHSVLEAFGWDESETPQRIKETLVMELLRMDRISEATAAAVLDLNRWELLETMAAYNVSVIQMSPDELTHELTRAIEGMSEK